jgi:hypothetical protein
MEAGVLIVQLKSMSIPMMKKNASSVVLHLIAVAVLTAQLKNTDMDMVLISVFGVAQHQQEVVVRIVQQKSMKNSRVGAKVRKN